MTHDAPGSTDPPLAVRWREAFSRRSAAGFVLLLVVLAPVLLHRAGLQRSFFVDEIYTVVIVNRTFAEIVDLTYYDAHPPGYYFLLKFYLKPFRLAGIEPGLAITRGLGLACWALMAAGAWFGGRWLLGRAAGTLGAWALAAAAPVLTTAATMRQLAVALPVIFLCWLTLLILDEVCRHAPPGRARRRAQLALWAVYAAGAALSLWLHALCTIALALLAMLWLALCLRRRWWRTSFFRGGVVAHVAVALLFLPWLRALFENVRYVNTDVREWLTPANLSSLYGVFVFWFPYGDIPPPPWPQAFVTQFIGLLTLLPVALALIALLWRGRALPPADTSLRLAGLSGFAGAALFTMILWILNRLDVAPVFHGPRYPLIFFGPYVVGLAALAMLAARRMMRREAWAWAFAAPWFLASFGGQFSYLSTVDACAPAKMLREQPDVLSRDEPLYVLPSELLPYFRRALDGFDLRRIEQLADVPDGTDRAVVISLNNWTGTNRARDESILTALCQHTIAHHNSVVAYPPGGAQLWIFTLHSLRPADARRLAQGQLHRLVRRLPPDTASVAVPELQRRRHGWSLLLRDGEWNPVLLSLAEEATLRFDAPLEPGRYALHLVGWNDPYPPEATALRVLLPGRSTGPDFDTGEGLFEIEVPFDLTHPLERPEVRVRRALWRPSDHVEDSEATSARGFVFREAWITPARKRGTE